MLCCDCRLLVTDLLSGDTCTNERWRLIESEQATLSYIKRHLNGNVEAIARSGERGCPVCSTVAKELLKSPNVKRSDSYHIFVWDRIPETCEFQVAPGDITVFLKHFSERPRPITLVLYGQPVSALASAPESLGDIDGGDIAERPALLRLPEWDLGGIQSFKKAKEWLEECKTSHTTCFRSPKRLPQRVLYLGEPGEDLKVSLHVTRGEKAEYAALSYSWGEGVRLVTKRSSNNATSVGQEPRFPDGYTVERHVPSGRDAGNKMQFETDSSWTPVNIPLEVFPETLKDALHIAKKLEFRYIWVDSLCILQGDKYDWAHQGAAMTDIYGNSALTISATSNKNSGQRILRQLSLGDSQIGTLKVSGMDPKYVQVSLRTPMGTLDLEEEPISKRGWVFQERLVSVASLHYTNEGLVWECAHGTFIAHDQRVVPASWKRDWQNSLSQFALGRQDRYHPWCQWICAYSERDLYDSQDKFPAIAGVAKRFANHLGMQEARSYVAGLWVEDFRSGLLWHRHNRVESLIRMETPFVAPSWSWASVNGRLEYRPVSWVDSVSKGPGLEVIRCDIVEEHQGTFGRLLSGSVVVKGYIQDVTLDLQAQPYVRKRAFQECGVSSGFLCNENVLCMLDTYSPLAPRHLKCWCLRIGSHDMSGREGDVFLLLRRRTGTDNTFCRIGFAETAAWADRMKPTPDSGILKSPKWTELILE